MCKACNSEDLEKPVIAECVLCLDGLCEAHCCVFTRTSRAVCPRCLALRNSIEPTTEAARWASPRC
jgi:hypothetical protein